MPMLSMCEIVHVNDSAVFRARAWKRNKKKSNLASESAASWITPPLHDYSIAHTIRCCCCCFYRVQLPCTNLFRFSIVIVFFFSVFVGFLMRCYEHVIHQFNLVDEKQHLVGLLRRRKCALFEIMSKKNCSLFSSLFPSR